MLVVIIKRLFFISIMLALQACLFSPPIVKQKVLSEVSERSRLPVIETNVESEFWIPHSVNLSDGLTEREASILALANNRAFQSDLADLGLARSDLVEANQLPNPVLTVIFPVDGALTKFSIAQMLSFLWQRPQRIKTASLNVEQVADRLVQDGLGLMMNTSIAFSEYLHAMEMARLERERAETLSAIADIIDAKLRSGEGSQMEATISRNDAMVLEDVSITAAYEAESTALKLKTLMGFDDLGTDINPVKQEVSCNNNFNIDEVYETAINSRPDLEAARINIQHAGEAMGLEKSRILNLTANLDLNEQENGDYQVVPGFDLELPVFSQNQGGMARARADLEKAMAQYLAKKHEITLQVNDALAELNSACERVSYWQDSITPQLLLQESMIEKAFNAGETAYLSVLDNKQKMLVAEKSMANAVLIQKKAIAKLNFSVGQKIIGTPQ